MKKINFYNLIFAAMLLIFAFSLVEAQQRPYNNAKQAQSGAADANQDKRKNRRQKMLAQLNLSEDQIGQIRRINADNKPSMRQAQERLREANRNLDQAVYADDASENEVQTRIRQVTAAQAEVIKIRATTEAAVRRVLTAEQLGRFREIRRQFIEQSDTRREENRQMPRMNAPVRGLKNRRQQQQRQMRRQRRDANFISQ